MFNVSVNDCGNNTFSASDYAQFDNHDWAAAMPCHFDLNCEDAFDKGINGPGISITSLKNKEEATTFSLATASITTPPSASSIQVSCSTSTSATASQTSGTRPPNVLSANSGGSNGLSDGAIAGIAIGAGVGVIAVAVLGLILYHNHRRMQEIEAKIPKHHSQKHKPQGVDVAPPYLEASDQQTHEAPPASMKYAQEAPATSPLELELFRPLQELPGSITIAPVIPEEVEELNT